MEKGFDTDKFKIINGNVTPVEEIKEIKKIQPKTEKIEFKNDNNNNKTSICSIIGLILYIIAIITTIISLLKMKYLILLMVISLPSYIIGFLLATIGLKSKTKFATTIEKSYRLLTNLIAFIAIIGFMALLLYSFPHGFDIGG